MVLRCVFAWRPSRLGISPPSASPATATYLRNLLVTFRVLGSSPIDHAAPAEVVLGSISPIDHAASAEVVLGSIDHFARHLHKPSMVLLVTSARNIPTNSGGEAHAPLQQRTGTFTRCWG